VVGVAPWRTNRIRVGAGGWREEREVDERSDAGTGDHRRLYAVVSNQARAEQLQAVQQEVAECRLCPRLVQWREQVAEAPRASFAGERYWGRPVPGFGDVHARLAIVGLAPAAHGANRTGRMFTGDRSGDWLFAALYRAGYASQPTSTALDDGLVLHDAYITGAVHCAPPANKPNPSERAACAPYLARELDLLDDVRVVVVLGQFACQSVAGLLGVRPRPKFGHLAEHPLPGGRTLLCSYHPSQQNTFTGVLTRPMFDAVFERARAISGVEESAFRPQVAP
jgi:uracil-DNA glycosylase family 4